MALDYDHSTENLGSHFIFHIQSTLLLKKLFMYEIRPVL